MKKKIIFLCLSILLFTSVHGFCYSFSESGHSDYANEWRQQKGSKDSKGEAIYVLQRQKGKGRERSFVFTAAYLKSIDIIKTSKKRLEYATKYEGYYLEKLKYGNCMSEKEADAYASMMVAEKGRTFSNAYSYKIGRKRPESEACEYAKAYVSRSYDADNEFLNKGLNNLEKKFIYSEVYISKYADLVASGESKSWANKYILAHFRKRTEYKDKEELDIYATVYASTIVELFGRTEKEAIECASEAVMRARAGKEFAAKAKAETINELDEKLKSLKLNKETLSKAKKYLMMDQIMKKLLKKQKKNV